MWNRRQLLAELPVAAGALAVGSAAQAQAETSGAAERPPSFGFIGPEDDPTFGPRISGLPPSGSSVGTGPSRHDEVRTAFRLLFDAPRGKDQLAVARYFEGITKANGAGEKYNAEWAQRANPLIVGLFSMTNTNPAQGDQTSWCAAFVSFCLYAANQQTKFSALSGGYRSYGESTNDPSPGDIVVFTEPGEKGAKGFGHVGFFVGSNGSRIKVLGGNQSGRSGTSGAVITSEFPTSSASLQLHSFRKVYA